MTTTTVGPARWGASAARVSLVATGVSCLALLALHTVSPEFAPSWRMVSEYANGRAPWLLTIVFAGWALSSVGLAVALRPLMGTRVGTLGLLFLMLAAVGQTMGGLFDINHALHGPTAMIGIPSTCVAAVLLTRALAQRVDISAPPRWSAHLPWISFALMLGTLALLFSALQGAGVEISADAGPLKELPPGVSGYVGWANRLLFASTYVWAALASRAVLRATPAPIARVPSAPRYA